MSRVALESPPLSGLTKLAFGAGSGAYGVSAAVLSAAVLQLYFNQVIGLPAIWVGVAILASLMADLVFDPLVGLWSDNLRSRWGRRHPFMYASAIPAAGFFYLLWHAPHGLDGTALLFYSVGLLVLVRASLAAFEVPSAALMPELAPGYHERTALMAYRAFFAVAAIAIANIVLYSVFLRQDAANPLGVLNRERYAQFAVVGSVAMVVFILVSSLSTHSRIRYLHRPPERKASIGQMLAEMGRVFTNPGLVVLMSSYILTGVATGITTTLSTYWTLHLWALKPQAIGPLGAGALGASVLGVLLAPMLSKAVGKKPAMMSLLATAMIASMLPISARLLGIMPPNGSTALYVFLLADAMVQATTGLMAVVIMTSMVSDVIEDQQVKTGVRSEGVLFAVHTLVPKVTAGVGSVIAGALVSLVAFPVRAKTGSVDPDILRHLALLYLPCIAALNGAAIVALSFHRMDRATHEQNLARLREAAALAAQTESAGAEERGPGPAVGGAPTVAGKPA